MNIVSGTQIDEIANKNQSELKNLAENQKNIMKENDQLKLLNTKLNERVDFL
jgi:regulator of replication initiation timing